MADRSDPGFREFTITRVFDAPRELVWRAWTEPAQIALWFGPRGYTVPRDSVEMDVRPGGVFRLKMVPDDPEGRVSHTDGVFQEVVAPERLAFTESWTPHEGDDLEVLLTFSALPDDRTEMVCHVRMRATDEWRDAALAGWSSTLDCLEELLVQPSRSH
jgi:uncharacterized protein YndB with AHSA1/START domain